MYALIEFIEYFKSRSTSFYEALGLLDASKASDKISHWTLFFKCANIFSQNIMLLVSTSRNDCTMGFISIKCFLCDYIMEFAKVGFCPQCLLTFTLMASATV